MLFDALVSIGTKSKKSKLTNGVKVHPTTERFRIESSSFATTATNKQDRPKLLESFEDLYQLCVFIHLPPQRGVETLILDIVEALLLAPQILFLFRNTVMECRQKSWVQTFDEQIPFWTWISLILEIVLPDSRGNLTREIRSKNIGLEMKLKKN